jgi:septal ring factor EnvC (AmiA/AmiB activator)
MLFLWLLTFSLNSHADNSAVNYEKNRQDYIHKEEQNRNVLSELYKTQQNIKKINSDRNKLLTKKESIERHIGKLNPLVQSAEQKISSQKIDIQKRLLYLSKFQDMSVLKVVFSSQSPSELDRNLRILKNLTDRDYVLLKTYFKNVKTLKIKQKELLAKRESLLNLEKEISSKEIELQSGSAKKNQMLADIDSQKSKLLSKLRDIRKKKSLGASDITKDDLQKEEFISTLFEPLFFERKGKLSSPVNGVVIQKYGYFTHPKYKTQIRHKGLFIGTNTTVDTKAVAKGKVVHLENSRESGYTIVIDHADHYYSVYSYMNEPAVNLNDEVQDGQVIAHSVQSHPFFGEGLYFEMRHFSEPIDPVAWFEPNSSKIATRRIR